MRLQSLVSNCDAQGSNNNNNNNNNHDNLWCCCHDQSHRESSPGSFDKCQTERRVAANPQTKPIDLGCESAENLQLPSTSTIASVIITQHLS